MNDSYDDFLHRKMEDAYGGDGPICEMCREFIDEDDEFSNLCNECALEMA